ncbi:MAG TPA: HTH domain-containing protein [Candidatus Angelobacter sp.]|nr:HTH domain-containing protein [Candidatus Angelobacter sp.]
MSTYSNKWYERNRETILAKARALRRAKGITARGEGSARRWETDGAIWRCLARYGERGVSLSQLAQDIGVSRQTIYKRVYRMGGVKNIGWGRWIATGVTAEWLEVL